MPAMIWKNATQMPAMIVRLTAVLKISPPKCRVCWYSHQAQAIMSTQAWW